MKIKCHHKRNTSGTDFTLMLGWSLPFGPQRNSKKENKEQDKKTHQACHLVHSIGENIAYALQYARGP